MQNRIHHFSEVIFPKYQCDVCKSFNTQQCLIVMVEKWKAMLDKEKNYGALLTDLSKNFDCVAHDLLTAIFQANRLDDISL